MDQINNNFQILMEFLVLILILSKEFLNKLSLKFFMTI